MGQMQPKELDDKLILMYLPYALARVESSKNLTIDELREYRKQSSDFFRYVSKHSYDDHVALLANHRNDPYFGQYIERMLSQKGLEWLRFNYALMRRVAEEK